jgi:hypothetical protein
MLLFPPLPERKMVRRQFKELAVLEQIKVNGEPNLVRGLRMGIGLPDAEAPVYPWVTVGISKRQLKAEFVRFINQSRNEFRKLRLLLS